jgi:multidrug resistance protein, MATE family
LAAIHSIDVLALEAQPKRAILKLAGPTVIAMVLQSLVNEIDLIFFKGLPGCEATNAQAALFPSLLTVWLFGGTLAAIGVGTQAHTSRRYAEKNFKAAGAVLMNTIWFCLLAGLVMMLVGSFCLHLLLARMLSGPALEIAESYSRYRLFGVISMSMTIGVKAFFDGIGKTTIHFWASLIMNVFNVLFCYMFIFGKFGAPQLGAPGAGLGALSATWIGLSIMLGFAWRERKRYELVAALRIAPKLIWDLVKLGAPAGAATILMMAGFGVFGSFAGALDANSASVLTSTCGVRAAVNGAATSNIIGLMKLTFTACIGFGTATATLVGQSLGKQRPDLATKFGWASVRVGLVIFGIVGLIEGLLATHTIINFITEAPAVREAMVLPLRIMSLVTPIIAVAMILSEALFGAGSTKFVAAAQGLLVFCILIPVARVLTLSTNLGLAGMWLGAATYALMAAITMSVKFAGGSWKTIKL